MNAMKKQVGIHEIYGPNFNYKDGHFIGDQGHYTWMHLSFK